MSIHLHIPLMALLVGIVGRGCAFTFRHYDTLGKEYYRTFSRIFTFSSLWSAFFLGVTGGAVILGKINLDAPTYFELYVAPWLNSFCISMGIFTACLFAFLAAVYLVGEESNAQVQTVFRRKAAIANALMLVWGAVVFITAGHHGHDLTHEFFANPFSVTCFALAGVLWIPFWWLLARAGKGRALGVRVIGVGIVALVLFGWYAIQYPIAIRLTAPKEQITFQLVAAPESTLRALLGALIVGSFIIFPSLAYLFKVFKWETLNK